MQLTNKSRLPEPIFRAICNDPYDSSGCDISTTRLIGPPKIEALQKRYPEKISEDASDRLWSLMGQLMHLLLERGLSKAEIGEIRYYTMVAGWKLGGQIDLYDPATKTLYDYKYTTVYSYVFWPKEEWVNQANVNRYLMEKNGIEVKKLQNVMMFRDWAERNYNSAIQKGRRYPSDKVAVVDIPVWSMGEAQDYVRERVKLHKEAQATNKGQEDSIPHCSAEERWERNGKSARCLGYCAVKNLCDFGRNL